MYEEDTIIYPMGSKTAIMLWRLQVETPHNPFRYCGEYYDDETDLIYLRNRYYDNTTGRFITEDPIQDSINWYSYCGNDPVNHIDLLGLKITEDDKKYGVNSKVYTSLLILDEAQNAFPEYSSAIEELFNEIRWIGNEWGSKKIDNRVYNLLRIKSAKSLSTVEQVLTAAYTSQAIIMNDARNKADAMTKKVYKQDGNGVDIANAFKHIYWSAYATRKMGVKYTKLFTNAHEFGWYLENLNDKEAMKMDLHNNKIGREIGNTYTVEKIGSAVSRYISEGKAAVIYDGKSVLSTPTWRSK